MYINSRTAINEGWITFPTWMSDEQQVRCVQPNALDITLDALFEIDTTGTARITEAERNLRMVNKVEPVEGVWTLKPNTMYDCMSDFFVNVPQNVAAQLAIRSSLNRVGIHLNAGLYDSAFTGNVGFTLYNRSGSLEIGKGTRVAQLIFVSSPDSGSYEGIYNAHQSGTHWSKGVSERNFNIEVNAPTLDQ